MTEAKAWSDGQTLRLVMGRESSGGGFCLSLREAEDLREQINAAIRSIHATKPMLDSLVAALAQSRPSASEGGGAK